MDPVVIERSCFVGLVTSAVEAYNCETNGFLVGNRSTRVLRQRPREVTVLRAAYPLQTAERKPNWVAHGNVKAFRRAQRTMENMDVGYEVLGGFHSHTGHDGDAELSKTDLEYVAQELQRLRRSRSEDARWLEVVVALRRKEWARSHGVGWTTRTYRRKLGCTVAIDPTHGYDMTLAGYWVRAQPDGAPDRWDVVATEESRLLLPWSR